MRLQEIKSCIEKNKQIIDELLKGNGEERVLEIVKLLNTEELKWAIVRDNQLMILSSICSMWAVEKKIGDKRTFFDNIHSLAEAEDLYTNVKYYCRRFEYDMPEEYLLEGIEYIEKHRITGVALYSIIEIQTRRHEKIMVKLARYLKQGNALMTALIMLQVATRKYDKSEELLLELADAWISLNQWKQAYDTLQRIENPSEEVEDLIKSLEEVIGDEKL